jgi:murein DD-endopeptidase MepM/ murein hydrolase activator NlpD
MHRGLDIAAPIGTPIYASDGGTVISAGWNSGGYGQLIEIDHKNGYTTRYAHLNKISVKVGQEVPQGFRIGDMGTTGRSTGPHLHFEIRKGGGAVDPCSPGYLTCPNKGGSFSAPFSN